MKIKEVSVQVARRINVGLQYAGRQTHDTREFTVSMTAEVNDESEADTLFAIANEKLDNEIRAVSKPNDEVYKYYVDSRVSDTAAATAPKVIEDEVPRVRGKASQKAPSPTVNLDGGLGELRDGSMNKSFRGEVVSITPGVGSGPKQNIVIADRDSELILPVWDDNLQCDVGDILHVDNCWKVETYNGKLQARTGKGVKFTVMARD